MRRIFDFIEALFIVFVVVGGLGGAMICGAAYLTYAITGELSVMEEGITQVIWNGFVILAAVLTTLGAIIVTLVNCFRKGW